jgi:hypothetical protein
MRGCGGCGVRVRAGVRVRVVRAARGVWGLGFHRTTQFSLVHSSKANQLE